MSESRLNHRTVSYENYLIVIGGHNLKNMMPTEVNPAVCYNIKDEDPTEEKTP